jgi:FkbM family methyltransferase
MKRLIVGTFLGRLALSIRESIGLAFTALIRPEIAGTVANDHLAGFLVSRLCAREKTFIDVGAHIGSVVAEVTRHCPQSKIVAVEAIPDKVAHLQRSFPHALCHACALSDTEGEATFFVNQRRSGYSSLERPSGDNGADIREIKVALRRLDSLVTDGKIDVIKIDVEGAELGVLRGSERVIRECRPTILFESGPSADGSAAPKTALWEWFTERQYAVLVPNRVAHDDPGLSSEGFVESHLYPRRSTNYFAVPQERRIEIRDKARAALKIRTAGQEDRSE